MAALIWGLVIISLWVIAIVGILLLIGLFRRRPGITPGDPAEVPLARTGAGIQWIYVGSAISAAVLLGAAIWTFVVLGAVSQPEAAAPFEIEIIGHQWWWEVHYYSTDSSRDFTTANEIHIPTGEPVRFIVSTTDVIHSFWAPMLSGKMDTILGQHNETWLEADKPGTYRGSVPSTAANSMPMWVSTWLRNRRRHFGHGGTTNWRPRRSRTPPVPNGMKKNSFFIAASATRSGALWRAAELVRA